MSKKRTLNNMLNPSMSNINQEIVDYPGNLKDKIYSTVGNRHPTHMKGSPINTYTLSARPVQKVLPEDPIHLKEKSRNPQKNKTPMEDLLRNIKNRSDIINRERENISGPGFFGFFKPPHANVEVDRKRAKTERKNPIMGGASRKKPKTRKNRKKRKTRKRKQKN